MYYGAVTEGRIVFGACDAGMKKDAAEYIAGNIADCIFWNGGQELVFCGGSIEYSDGLFKDLFERMKGICCEGEIKICGEDWEVWCFRYDASAGRWKKHTGCIVYGSEGEEI